VQRLPSEPNGCHVLSAFRNGLLLLRSVEPGGICSQQPHRQGVILIRVAGVAPKRWNELRRENRLPGNRHQRESGGTGFSRGWKIALWARLYEGNRAAEIFRGYIQEQCYGQLFAKCYAPLQIDGTMGVAAGITEMLVQSHEGIIDLLPALPDDWEKGRFDGYSPTLNEGRCILQAPSLVLQQTDA